MNPGEPLPGDLTTGEDLAAAEAVLANLATAFFPAGMVVSGPENARSESSEPPPAEFEELPDTASRYRILLEQMPAVLFIAYIDRGIGEAYVSPHIEHMLGFTHREWLEEPVRWYRQIHDEDKARWSIDAAKFFLTGEPLQAVYRVTSESGRIVWFQCQAKMVRRPDGRPLLVHGLGFDVTELKQTEQSLTEALHAAQAASRAKTDFLANMSHEIRTPINGIMGMTNLALETDLTPEQRDYLTTVKQSADSLLCVVDDILDLSKMDAKTLELEIAPFNLRQTIEETARHFAQPAREKGLELFYRVYPCEREIVTGDAVRLKQILMNLIGNAIKFTARGEIKVGVEVEAPSPGETQFHFQVADTGIGIAREQQKLIFKSFSQVDTSASRRYGGTGLGLTICSGLVEMMGGRLWVESEPGIGSKFHFTVRFGPPCSEIAPANEPARQDPVPQGLNEQTASLLLLGEALARHAPVIAPAPPAETIARLDILLAEDNAVNQKIATRILEKHGHRVEVAVNGIQALLLFEKTGFDLILMDLQMPEMGGLEATSLIRERETTGRDRIPIIALTAHALKGDREQCLAAGMDDYVSKPVVVQELLAAIDKVRARCRERANELRPA